MFDCISFPIYPVYLSLLTAVHNLSLLCLSKKFYSHCGYWNLKNVSLQFITQDVQEGKMEALKYVPYSHMINSVYIVG